MISYLCPTRKRPQNLDRMVKSIRDTAYSEVDIVLYIDADDTESMKKAAELDVTRLIGPRIILSQCWNELVPFAKGEIFINGNDDIVMRTPGWDLKVEQAFAEVPDRIVLVHGHDGGHCGKEHAAIFMIHKRWIEVTGRFQPPYFDGDFPDVWMVAVANALGRRKYIDILTEHMHPVFGKAELDETYLERREREKLQNVRKIYDEKEYERCEEILKLREAIVGSLHSV